MVVVDVEEEVLVVRARSEGEHQGRREAEIMRITVGRAVCSQHRNRSRREAVVVVKTLRAQCFAPAL